MQRFLSWCFWEGMTIDEAKKFYKGSHGEKEISERSIKIAVEKIKKYTNKEWK